MPQYTQHRTSDWLRTLHGFGHLEESAPLGGDGEPAIVAIGAPVGRGGQVFETEAGAGPGRHVVKLFTWAAGLPERVVREFTRDAITVANLRHPHVVAVVDAGTLGDGTPFVVMERLAGLTLDEAAGGRPLRMAELLPILRGVGAALAAAHAAGIAHGAIRAEDIFMAEVAGYGRGFPKLLDFGVARLAAGARALGRVAGEGASVAPAGTGLDLGGRAGERADQLALAALAWRLAGGAAPPVQRVLARAMSPDPSQRFGSVTALVEALDEASMATLSGAAHAPVVTTIVGSAAHVVSSGPTASVGSPVSVASPASVASPVSMASPASVPFPAATMRVAPPAVASAPSSLTQQFFAEGERQDLAHAAESPSEDDETTDEGAGAADAATSTNASLSRALGRVPRSRTQMTVAALLGLGSVAVIGWTVLSLARAHGAGGPLAVSLSPAPALVQGAAAPVGPFRSAGPAARSAAPQPVGAQAGTSAAVRGAKVAARRASHVQPPPFAVPAQPSPPPPATTALPSPAGAAAPPTPGALPPAGLPSAPGAPPPAPAAASAAAPPNDPDVTQPWEQTEGAPSVAAPAPGAPSAGTPGSGEARPAPPAEAAPAPPPAEAAPAPPPAEAAPAPPPAAPPAAP